MVVDIVGGLRKFSTAVLSDALDSLNVNGGLEGITPHVDGIELCGPAFTVEFGLPENDQHIKAADYIDEVPFGNVVVLANRGRVDCTVWGGILTTKATINGIAGTVIDGAFRDLDEIRRKNYPMFSKSVFMKTGKGRARMINKQGPILVSGVHVNPGDYIRGDANGVLVVPKDLVVEVLKRSLVISKTEDGIVSEILNGRALEDARQRLNYHQPWSRVDDLEESV